MMCIILSFEMEKLSMYLVCVDPKIELKTKNGFLDRFQGNMKELPAAVEYIAEGVWLIHSVEALSFLIELGRCFPEGSLTFQVKGLNPQ